MKRALLALMVSLSPSPAEAQVLITEIAPNTALNAEWVEIHNTGTVPANIGGWQLHDWAGMTAGRLYAFPADTMLGADQVIIIAQSAAAYATVAMTNAYPDTTADFELGITGADDPNVPNLTPNPSGDAWALNNSGDAVWLIDVTAAQIDVVEWGVDRAEIAGTPAPNPQAGQTVCRTNDVGNSSLDFVVCRTPTPGTGYAGAIPTPPSIANPVRAPATLGVGSTFSVSATVTDAEGVASVSLYLASASAPAGPADAAYLAVPAPASGSDNYRASGQLGALITFPAPTGFAERYVRYFLFASDAAATSATLPASAITTADNAAYYWENVLPEATVFSIAEARQENASEVPIFDGHSIRIEGVALTTREAFVGGLTNFFIASPAGVDAIRVFDDVLTPTAIAPGDVVRVTGKIGVYRGVRQIGRDERTAQPSVRGPELEVSVMGTARVPMVTTDVATLLANGEVNESQLVQIGGVMLVPNPNNDPIPSTWIGNSTLYVSDGTGTLAVRVASFVDLADTPTPSGTFDLRGIFTQFAPTGTGGYQLQPRGLLDVIGSGPPIDGGVEDGGEMDGGGELDGGSDDRGQMDVGPGGKDGGNSAIDSGVDTGTGSDASDVQDDAGFFGTDPDRRGGGGGCGCSSARESQERHSWLWGLVLLLLATAPSQLRRIDTLSRVGRQNTQFGLNLACRDSFPWEGVGGDGTAEYRPRPNADQRRHPGCR